MVDSFCTHWLIICKDLYLDQRKALKSPEPYLGKALPFSWVGGTGILDMAMIGNDTHSLSYPTAQADGELKNLLPTVPDLQHGLREFST